MAKLGLRAGNQWEVDGKHADLSRRARLVPQVVRLAAESKDITVDLAKSAMIVIDMQNDFCHPKGWLAGIGVDVAPARKPIAPLKKLLPVLRAAGAPVIWLNWGNRPDLANISPALLHVYNGDGRSIGLGSSSRTRRHRTPKCWKKIRGAPPWSMNCCLRQTTFTSINFA